MKTGSLIFLAENVLKFPLCVGKVVGGVPVNYSRKRRRKEEGKRGETERTRGWDSPTHRNATLPNPRLHHPVQLDAFSRLLQNVATLSRAGEQWLSLGNHTSRRRSRQPERLKVDSFLSVCSEDCRRYQRS